MARGPGTPEPADPTSTHRSLGPSGAHPPSIRTKRKKTGFKTHKTADVCKTTSLPLARASPRKVTSRPPSLGGFGRTAEMGPFAVTPDAFHSERTSGHRTCVDMPTRPVCELHPAPDPVRSSHVGWQKLLEASCHRLLAPRRRTEASPASLADRSRGSCESKNKHLPNPGQHRGPRPRTGKLPSAPPAT